MAHEMHDTGLHGGVGEGCVDGVRETFQAINDGNQDILQAWEYPRLCVWGLAHAVKTDHLLNRSGYRIAN